MIKFGRFEADIFGMAAIMFMILIMGLVTVMIINALQGCVQ